MIDLDSVRVEVRRDKADFASAVWLNFWHMGGWGWPLSLALALGAWRFLDSVSELGTVAALSRGAMAAAVVLAIMIPLYMLQAAATVSKIMRLPGALDAATYVFSRNTLDIQASIGTSSLKWVLFKRAFENDRVLVIRQHTNSLLILPRRHIEAQSEAKLKNILRTALRGRVAFKPALVA